MQATLIFASSLVVEPSDPIATQAPCHAPWARKTKNPRMHRTAHVEGYIALFQVADRPRERVQ
jgi:hypothetical protein